MKPVVSFDVEAEIDEPELEKFLNYCEEALKQKEVDIPKGLELVIALVSPERSQSLNKQFRGRDKATDVLSFHSDDPESIGELVLCPEVIEAQALKNEWDRQYEYSYMILHGLLHLLGYEHETDDRAATEMYSLQDDIFFEYFPGAK